MVVQTNYQLTKCSEIKLNGDLFTNGEKLHGKNLIG